MKLNLKQSIEKLKNNGKEMETLFRHGSLDVELYKPKMVDHQHPHSKDEVYFIASGKSHFLAGGQHYDVETGDVLFVPANQEHSFSKFTDDFSTWVFFYGPEGGEKA